MIAGNRTRDGELGAILREILMVQALHNIELTVNHVRGETNVIADALSRIHMSKSVDYKLELSNKGYREHHIKNSAFILNMEL